MNHLSYKSNVYKYDPTNKGLFEKLFSTKKSTSLKQPELFYDLKDQYGRVTKTGLNVLTNSKKFQHMKDFYDSYDAINNQTNLNTEDQHILETTKPITEVTSKLTFRDRVIPSKNENKIEKVKTYISQALPSVKKIKDNAIELSTSYNNYDIDLKLKNTQGKKYLDELSSVIKTKEKEKKLNLIEEQISNLKFEIKKIQEQNELDRKHLDNLRGKNIDPYDDFFKNMALNVERLVRYKKYLEQLKKYRLKDFAIFEDNLESLITRIRNDVYNSNYNVLKDINIIKHTNQDAKVFKDEIRYYLDGIREELNKYKAQQKAEKEFVYDKYTDKQYLIYKQLENKKRIENFVYDTSELNPLFIERDHDKEKILEENDELYCESNFDNKEVYLPYSKHNPYRDIYIMNEQNKKVETKKIDFGLFEKSNQQYSEYDLRNKIWRSQKIMENFRYLE